MCNTTRVSDVDAVPRQIVGDVVDAAPHLLLAAFLANFRDGNAFGFMQKRQRILDRAARLAVFFQPITMFSISARSTSMPGGTTTTGRPTCKTALPGSSDW